MVFFVVFVACIAGAAIAGWIALIAQALSSGGDREPYFASELDFHAPPYDDDVVILNSDVTFFDSTGDRFTSPRGMESDGASIWSLLPWPVIGLLARWVLRGTPLTGPFRQAAIVHDGIYARAVERAVWRALIAARRAVGDRVIFEAARCRQYRLPGGRIVRRRPAELWRAFLVMALLRIAGVKAWMDDSSKAQLSLNALNRKCL